MSGVAFGHAESVSEVAVPCCEEGGRMICPAHCLAAGEGYSTI